MRKEKGGRREARVRANLVLTEEEEEEIWPIGRRGSDDDDDDDGGFFGEKMRQSQWNQWEVVKAAAGLPQGGGLFQQMEMERS